MVPASRTLMLECRTPADAAGVADAWDGHPGFLDPIRCVLFITYTDPDLGAMVVRWTRKQGHAEEPAAVEALQVHAHRYGAPEAGCAPYPVASKYQRMLTALARQASAAPSHSSSVRP